MDRLIVRTLALVVAAGAAAGLGCAPAATLASGSPVADPDSTAAAVLAATRPATPRQTTFRWRLDEAGSVVRGEGVVRYQPDRIRLDLFGPRGETYLIAALVEEEFRLPPAAAGAFELPSQGLLWGALGVVHPPSDAALAGVTESSDGLLIRYAGRDGTEHRFHLTADARTRLTRVERIDESGIMETVQVEYSADGLPVRTTYVDRRSYRELVLETESSRDVDSFPPGIWRPDEPGAQP